MISVIIPIYNIEKYLQCCVDSVLGQTYSDYEIILVDDGSTDDSGRLSDAYASYDSRIRVIHRENGGLSAARNTGIENAKGEYLFFLDGDDALHPRALELLMNTMDESSADLVFCGRTFVDENATLENMKEVEGLGDEPSYYTGRQVLLLQGDLMTGLSVIAWNKLYRAEQFARVRYPEGRVFEDAATTHLVLYDLEKVAYLPAQLCYYRQREGSIMADQRYVSKINDHLEAFKEQAEFYKSRGDKELCAIAWDRYESNLAHLILLGKKEDEPLVDVNELRHRYREVLGNELKGLPLGIKSKIKLHLFTISEQMYEKIRGMK